MPRREPALIYKGILPSQRYFLRYLSLHSSATSQGVILLPLKECTYTGCHFQNLTGAGDITQAQGTVGFKPLWET